ncbi:MAG: hypothetical protein DRQ62_15615 [Gammaproteobacteria bacterium]|nr:MAG: hypothetical protein DRQ62_15615 [Gammaproteobacteria bacterium]
MIKKSLISACLITSIGFAGSASAYNAGNIDLGCKKPRFKTFTPPHKGEADPESEISFTVSGYADQSTIKEIAKNIPLKLTIVDRDSFYAVSATLPAELTGKYARIHVKANNTVDCKAKDGWLIKIRDTAAGSEVESTEGASAETDKEAQ